MKKIKDIQLANGSNALRGMTLSPDNRYLLVTHNLGRFQVPTSQLQQGWMNTSAVSLVNVQTLNLKVQYCWMNRNAVLPVLGRKVYE